MSKKSKIILFVSVSLIVVLAILVATVVVLDMKLNIGRHISGWTPESDEEVLNVRWNTEVDFKDHTLNLYEKYEYNGFKIRPMEIFCINAERIWFVFSSGIKSTDGLGSLWHIASIKLDGSDFVVNYTCNLFDISDYNGSKDGYSRLAYKNDDDNLCGGIYINGKIYLRGRDHSVEYDIATNTGREMEEFPKARYKAIFSEDFKQITISDCEQNIAKTISLESMASENEYAKKIVDVVSGKTGVWVDSGNFSVVKITGDRIIIIYSIMNAWGHSISAVFDYNFSSEEVRFMSSGGEFPTYAKDYSLVTFEH